MYGLKLVVGLVVAGGVIAYIGDKIGMKVGKNRLSLFGLRPKYTSILVTICTGIVIALLSLSLLLVVSQQFRQALFEMEDLLKEKKELTQEVKKLAKQKQDLAQQVGNLAHNLSLFGRGYFQSVTGEVSYKRGEILAEETFVGTQTAAEIEANLKQLIQQTKQQQKLARINYHQLELKRAVTRIQEEPRTVVRLVAAQNSFQADKLLVSFDLYRAVKVYPAGTEILTYRVDSTNLEAVINQLVANLNQAGVEAGMLPDNQGQIVEVDIVKFNQLVNQLKQINSPHQILVRAAETIWSSDQLEDKINFKVEAVE